ncbi:ABC transporter substrate-binding protein [Capillimicrobium parvum]|uniref:Thiamine pyrimidine synthase n=1 Tax=Capillimicrobium parvum TaxID=2884022 RepID=A0A9E6XW18_9ACTN|nr:ABC transporter substrate-binding protein [Capillimicrobium parvum]UGS35469.1 Formylaminopyrimidine-binding protein [Capillimicrobium parvum]
MRRLVLVWVLLSLSAAALLLSGCGTREADRPNADATLLLDFTPNGVHAGIYSAVARGYDTAEGVHLRVRQPSSSSDAVKLLLGGRTDFAVLDIHDLAIAREQGRDVVGVMSIAQRPLAAVLAQPGTRSPRDLQGHRVGVTGLPSDEAVLRSIVKGAGGEPEQVRTTTIGFNAVPALLGGKVAGATAFWDVEGVALQRRRPGFRQFRVDEFGAPSYPELVLCVTHETLRDKPALVRATVAALQRGYRFTLEDPESSAADLLSQVPAASRDEIMAQLDVLDSVFTGPTGVPGALDPGVLRDWARWEARFGITRRPPDVAEAFDTRYANASLRGS